MSGDRVEIARRAMEDYSRGDWEAALRNFHPGISWEAGSDLMFDARDYRGHDGVRQFWGEWADLFPDFRLDIEECAEVGKERVLAVTRASGTGAASGAPVRSPRFAQIFYFEGGKVVRVRLYASRRAAEAALRES